MGVVKRRQLAVQNESLMAMAVDTQEVVFTNNLAEQAVRMSKDKQ